jgi:DNA-binding transcriptional LysR family regulator
MNSDFYRNFVRIVDCGTISAAAEQLHIAQPALSNQIKQFEKLYGTELFIRNTRKMQLTDAGRILYNKALGISALEDAAYKEISACAEGSQGTVRIGMTQAYPDGSVTGLLLGFHRENPGIMFEFYELTSGSIIELLKNEVAEVGIVRLPGMTPAFLTEQLRMEQRLCAYGRRDNPWVSPRAGSVAVSSLEGVPLAISRGFGPTVDEILRREDVAAKIFSVSTSRMNPMMWAGEGAAIAVICAGEASQEEDGEMFCLPLSSEDADTEKLLHAHRSVVTVKGRGLSAAAERFVDYCQKNQTAMG